MLYNFKGHWKYFSTIEYDKVACALYLAEPKLNHGIYSFGEVPLQSVEHPQKPRWKLSTSSVVEGRACCILMCLV